MALTISDLNNLDDSQFIHCLADIYEHSTWVAVSAVAQRPYPSLAALAQQMQHSVLTASTNVQMTLIRAHPELAGKLAISGNLTTASQAEQASAGLGDCTTSEFIQLAALNQAYQRKFNFPFIIAVRGLHRTDIINAIATRCQHSLAQEIDAALHEIGRIAQFRLKALITTG